MIQAGGPAAINGFLYQIIHHLGWMTDVTLSGKLNGKEIKNACLVLEPRCGGDARAEASSTYLVEQYKTRRNGTWAVSDMESILRDLRKAVPPSLPKHAIYRFVTDGRAGRLETFKAFLTEVKMATEPCDLNTAERKKYSNGFSGTSLDFLKYIAAETRSSQQSETTDEILVIFHLLSCFEMKFCINADDIAAGIDRLLRPYVPELGDEQRIREHLIGLLFKELSQGESRLDLDKINELLRIARLNPERLRKMAVLSETMSELTRRHFSHVKYQPSLDVRGAPEWPKNKPALLITGKSGVGKTWQLARLLKTYKKTHQIAILLPTAKSIETLLSRTASALWQTGLNETSEKNLVGVSNFLREFAPNVTTPKVVIAFDDIQDVDLARDLVRQDWVGWGMHLALTVTFAVAQSLQLTDKNSIHVHYVDDFSIDELNTLLEKNGQKWADLPADLKKLLRNPILAGLFLKLPSASIQNALHSEYEIFEKFWLRIVEKGRPGDEGIVTALAAHMCQGKSYPLPRPEWHEVGLDGEALARLDAAGWLHCLKDGEVAFAHARLLNWAVAKSLVSRFQNKKMSVADLGYFLTGKGNDGDRHIRRRLNYVAMDTLWLLAENEQNSKTLGQLIEQLEDSREFGSYGEDLYARLLPTLGPRAVPILLERLSTILADSNDDYRVSLIGKSFTKLAQQESVDLKKTIDSLLNTPNRGQQKVAIAALTAAPDANHLDRLWEIHQQCLISWKSKIGNLSHVDYQASFAALRSGIALDPEWLRNRILSADAKMEPVFDLGYQLQGLEHIIAPKIWEETRDVLIEKIPPNKLRSFINCTARFSDYRMIGFVSKHLSSEEDYAGSAALSALSVLDPLAAIEQLTKVQESERCFTRNQWLPVLLRTQPELTRQRILEQAIIDSRGRRLIEDLFRERPDEIDAAMLQFVLHSLEEELQKHLNADAKNEPNWLSRSLDFLGGIVRQELLPIIATKVDSELEQMIVDIACDRLHSNSNNRDSLREGARRILILIGGDGITTLIKRELNSEHYWVRYSGLSWAFVRNDSCIAKKLAEIVCRPVARDINGKLETEPYQEFFQALIALSAIGNNEILIESLKRSGVVEVPSDLAMLRAHHNPMPKVLTNRALETLQFLDSPEPELLNALIVTWLSNDVDLIPDVRTVLQKTDLESRVAVYACISLQALGDSSDEFMQLAQSMAHTKSNSIWGLNALLNMGARGFEQVAELLEGQGSIKCIEHKDQIIRSLYDNPTTKNISIDAAVKYCQRGHHFKDALYDIAAEANEPILREKILDVAFTVDSIMPAQQLRAIEGLAKFHVIRAVEAIELALQAYPSIERQLCKFLVRIVPEVATEKLINAAILVRRESFIRVAGQSLRQIDSKIVSRHIVKRMSESTSYERKIITELSGWLCFPEIIDLLGHLADNDSASDVRQAAFTALEYKRRETNILKLYTVFPSTGLKQQWGLLITILDAADPNLLTEPDDRLWLGNILSETTHAVFSHHANSVLKQRKRNDK